MKHASTRVRVYLTISFLLSLFLFHLGTLHNPQGEFIDLDSNELDWRYTTLFFALNMMMLLGLPLVIEMLLLVWARFRRRQTMSNRPRRSLGWALTGSAGAALAIGAVAAYAAWRHGQEARETVSLLLHSAGIFFVLILMVQTIVHMMATFCRKLLER
ncbi:hypothetical protein [Dongia sp.]|uniref:hypothetical protein n=1 Tax=Dongia sp. TaxID=1977262 RepID=UPI0035B4F350